MNPNQPDARPGAQQKSDGPSYRAGCGALGVVMALFSVCGVIAFATDLVANRKPEEVSVLLALSVFFAGTAVAGILIARHYFRKPPARPNVELENRILQLAYAHQARLSVPQVALHCRVSIEESREALERMVTQGVALPQVDDDGTISYFFDDLLPPPGVAPRGQVRGGPEGGQPVGD
ncbi:MAG TPA: hypothetical protein VN228_18875 [Pyrinomonadaceae bacterium]|nr:hypothetical protein [Pyrinomonadaceae bacterium]